MVNEDSQSASYNWKQYHVGAVCAAVCCMKNLLHITPFQDQNRETDFTSISERSGNKICSFLHSSTAMAVIHKWLVSIPKLVIKARTRESLVRVWYISRQATLLIGVGSLVFL